LARTLLAGTCLTSAAGVASASNIVEGVGPAPPDFSNTSPGFLLPAGTTQVYGTVTSVDPSDWFQFQKLPGSDRLGPALHAYAKDPEGRRRHFDDR
jgi:hypothetical protein